MITDQGGNTVWQWDNTDPYGDNLPNQDPNGTGNQFVFNLRMSRQYADIETGTNYNYYRDYDSRIGAYIQSDPAGLSAGQVSTYAYVGGNPLKSVDVLGLWNMDVPPPGPNPKPPKKCQCSCQSKESNYWNNYADFVREYGIDVGDYAWLLGLGVMPKSMAPATGFRGPLLGSSNPLTSVPRGFGVPGAGEMIPRMSASAIGLATVGIGMYDATVEVEGLVYALPDCTCQ